MVTGAPYRGLTPLTTSWRAALQKAASAPSAAMLARRPGTAHHLLLNVAAFIAVIVVSCVLISASISAMNAAGIAAEVGWYDEG